MIYFRQRKISIESPERVEKLLNQSTSKVLTMFDLTSTSTYIILEERPFVGQKSKNGETMISRYRHSLFKIVPRIISKWKVESIDDDRFLVIKNRLGFLPTLVLLMIAFPLLVEVVKSILRFEIPDLEIVTSSSIFLMVFVLLVKYELGLTERTILKVINNEKTKSLITI
jgi:hypothetical protein